MFCRKYWCAGTAAALTWYTPFWRSHHCPLCQLADECSFPPKLPQWTIMTVTPVSCHLSALCKCTECKGRFPGVYLELVPTQRGASPWSGSNEVFTWRRDKNRGEGGLSGSDFCQRGEGLSEFPGVILAVTLQYKALSCRLKPQPPL